MRTSTRQLIASAAVVLTLGAPHASSVAAGAPLRTSRLDAAGIRRLAIESWRSYRAAAAGPTIRVSAAYPDAAAIAQRWSSFFQSLMHGPELGLLNAYIAPIDEVREICGSSHVLGCYGANRLVMPDEGEDGIAATSIATHEYGHHIAFNRVNPPWSAIDWGPKRWSTLERVCSRAAGGTAYPGDEGANYPLNPGEAWAETYRVLNENAAGLPLSWPIVDPSFEPDAGALAAARADVLDPWTGPTVNVTRARFNGNARSWTSRVTAPLDGQLNLQVRPGSDDVTLLSTDARSPLARGTWSTTGTKELSFPICGERTFLLRITRHAASRRFVLRLSLP